MKENKTRLEELKDAVCRLVCIAEDAICRKGFEELDNAGTEIIGCLEEIQQYRAIGTVEGYKRALEISKENFRVSMEYKAKVQAFEAIGTIEEFKALKEKSVAKKVEYFSETFQSYTCPSCETPINNGGMAKGVYCKWCGQKLDWSE